MTKFQLSTILNDVCAGLITLLLLCVSVDAAEKNIAATSESYPTLDRVEFVLGCMHAKGGQDYTNLYGCVCLLDKIAAIIPYQSFLDAQTLQVMMQTPGERGGAFRDAPGARKLTNRYDQIVAENEPKCFVK